MVYSTRGQFCPAVTVGRVTVIDCGLVEPATPV
jgi:hypothetical protein